jgi:polygalacturonase
MIMRMKICCIHLQVFVLLVSLSSCNTDKASRIAKAWENPDKIIARITEPEFPDRLFFISEFEGKGDGETDNKKVFQDIIDSCSRNGGGKIIVEKGVYLINGPIHLRSNIHLVLEKDSKLVFGSDPRNYLPVVLTSWEGTKVYNYSPFIYTYGATNVAITGEGEIDGSSAESWAKWKELQKADKKLLRKMNNENIPVKQRVFGEGHYLRPHLIQFYNCKNILVEGIKISDSPFWCLHLIYSENITIRNLTYEANNFNNDGIDPESCTNVLI